MASITFDFLSRGADQLAHDFTKTGDTAELAARGVRVLQDVVERLGSRENRTAAESRLLATALRQTGDAADRAAAKALVADAAIRRLADAMQDANRKASALSRIGNLIPGLQGTSGGASGLGALAPAGGLLTNPYALAGIAAGVTALLPELAGLVSGFAAAGAGAGAFYLLAHPAINNLQGDIQKLNSANQALGFAQQKYLIDPTRQNAAALQRAQLQYKAIYAQMGQDAGPAAAGVLKLHDAYVSLTNAFQPQVFKIFNDGLKIANQLLPSLLPFATAFANALDGLLKKLAVFTASKGFQDWLKQFQGLVGPATTAIGEGLGKVIIQLGKLLTIMSAKDVVNAINIAFTVLSGTIDGFRHVIEALMRAWVVSSATVARVAPVVAAAFLQIGITVTTGAKLITNAFLDMVQAILNGAAKAFGWIPGLGGRLRGAAADFATWRGSVNADFDKVIAKMQAWQNQLTASKNTSASATQSIGQNFSLFVATPAGAAAKKVSDLAWALTHLPAKTSVLLTETGVGNFTITQGTSGHAGGTPTGGKPGAAAGMYVAIGSGPTADDVLIRASRGELIVPAPLVAAGLVDHLKGLIPGFAAGGSIGALAGQTTGFHDRFIAAMTAAMEKAMTAAMKTAVAAAVAAAAAVGGAGVGRWAGVVRAVLGQLGLPAGDAATILSQISTESGGNPTIVNKWDSNWAAGHPSVGLMQVIAGTFARYAGPYRGTGPFSYGVSTNPTANVYAGTNYAVSTYGNPGFLSVLGHGHGYDRGGWLQPGLTLAYNGTGRPEQVIPGGGMDGLVAELRGLRAEVRQLTGVAAAIPARTGQHVAAGVNGAAAAASFRVRYP